MTVEELSKKDKTFIESEFISNVNTTFIALLGDIMTENITKIKHKLSPSQYSRYEEYLKNLKKRNQRQMYEEPSIVKTEIEDITEYEYYYTAKVVLTSNYIHYIMDKDTKKIIIGDKNKRILLKNILTFSKTKREIDQNIIKKCQKCGASLDINNSGICPYCHSTYETYKYDWILEKIENE